MQPDHLHIIYKNMHFDICILHLKLIFIFFNLYF
jgi:hypothetical protein